MDMNNNEPINKKPIKLKLYVEVEEEAEPTHLTQYSFKIV